MFAIRAAERGADRETEGGARSLEWQPTLFGGDGVAGCIDRLDLDGTSWVDHAPAWLCGADALFDHFLASLAWEQRQRAMYDDIVWEPRLTASMTPGSAPPRVRAITSSLGRLYGARFDRMWLNLYRDGADSVAWHGDRIQREVLEPMVAIVSLGATRTFALRLRGGGPAVRLAASHGDLIVMGGRCQHDWEHCVPKTRRTVGPRISFTARHSRPAASDRPCPEVGTPP